MKKDEVKEMFFYEVCGCLKLKKYLTDLYTEKNEKYLKGALNFFNDMYLITIDHAVLRVLRLFEGKKTGKHENFSIDKIIELTDLENNEVIAGLLEKLKDDIEQLKEYRHKYLAHLDYEKIKNNERPPAFIELKNCLFSCIDGLHAIYSELCNYGLDEDEKTHYSNELNTNAHSDLINILSIGNYVWNNREKKNIKEIILEKIRYFKTIN